MQRLQSGAILTFVSLLIVCGMGCSYLKNRGNDLLDIVQPGITVNTTWKPSFVLYFKPSFLPIGYGSMKGKLIGLGNRHFGINEFEAYEYGFIIMGKERYGTGPFNPEDPCQIWPTYDRDDPSAPKERPTYYTGLPPVFLKNKPVLWTKFLYSSKAIHLGWIGINLPHSPFEALDFLLGFTTLDFMGDDTAK